MDMGVDINTDMVVGMDMDGHGHGQELLRSKTIRLR
jgi:hypothetical protein